MSAASDQVLVVEDDAGIRELVCAYLKKQGLGAVGPAGGREMRKLLQRFTPDVIVLDLVLPGDDGLELCREIRKGQHRAIPIVIVSARDHETDRVVGLELGADDYIAKPFSVRELLARLRAVLRRARMLPPSVRLVQAASRIGFGDWRIDTAKRHLQGRDGVLVPISAAEYRLLRVFLDHPNRVLSRDQLLELAHGHDADQFDRSIDLLVSRLRQRLGDDARTPRYIKTLRGEGYVFASAITVLEDAP